MDKSSSAICVLYNDVVKGDPSPTWLRKSQEEDNEEAVKRAIVADFRFINILQPFTSYFVFQLLYITLSF